MRIDETTEAFWVLYLVNVLQPISASDLEQQTRRLMEASGKKLARNFNIQHALGALAAANMILSTSDDQYAVTVLGLQKLSNFNLGLARDKNRLFVLKDRFKKR